MKTSESIKFFLYLLLPVLILVNCDKTDNPPDEADGTEILGTFTLKTSLKKEIKIDVSAKNFTLQEILNETRITVKDSYGNEVLNEIYPDLPDPIELPIGDYSLFMIRKGDSKPSFDNPTYINPSFYFGGEAFVIRKDRNTEVSAILWLNHVKVVVDFSDKVLQAYPDIVADIFDPNPADATPEAEKLRWSVLENGTSGYIYIDTHDTELRLMISATDQITGQALSVTNTFTFPDVAFNQEFHFSITLSDYEGAGSLSIDFDLLPEELHEVVVPFPTSEVMCDGSNMSDYEILKKLSEANLDPDGSGDLLLGWDLTDTSMQSWLGVGLDAEGRVMGISINGEGGFEFIPEFRQLCRLTWLRIEGSTSSSLEVIWQLSNLESLTLFDSSIEVLPPEIGQLSNLRDLTVRRNSSAEIIVPSEIGKLKKLKYLDMRGSSVIGVPKELGLLSNLRSLDLSSNSLTSIPEELEQLPNLIFIDLSENPVVNIPQVVCDLDDVDTQLQLDDGSGGFPADVCN